MKRLNVIVDLNDQVFSGCIKFVADVLGDDNFTIHDQYSWKNYVEDAAKNNLKDAQEEYVVGACTSESPSQFATNKNAFDAVQMCRLPAIFDDIANNPPVCYAGLCTVVRKMVHHHAFNGKKQSTSLLVSNQLVTVHNLLSEPLSAKVSGTTKFVKYCTR